MNDSFCKCCKKKFNIFKILKKKDLYQKSLPKKDEEDINAKYGLEKPSQVKERIKNCIEKGSKCYSCAKNYELNGTKCH